MRNYINLFFLLLIFLSACGKKEAPPGVIKAEDMVGLMIDVHLADGSLYSVQQAPDTVYKYGFNRYLQVFKQHNTDSLQFKKSLKYYSRHPDQMDEIYVQVVQSLQDKLDKLNKPLTSKNAVPAQ